MKEDRRIRKSKNALKRALFEFIVKKSFSKISVSELCELADVNRSTFYSNYEDMIHLLSDIHKDFFDEMMKHATNYITEGLTYNQLQQQTLIGMIDYIDKNKKLVQILFNHSEPQLLEKNMVTYFTERYHTLESNKLNSYPFIYHTYAFFALLNTWVKDNFPCSATQFAQIIIEQSKVLYRSMSFTKLS